MTVKENIDMKGIMFLKNENKKLKDQVMKENNYDLSIAEDIELEIMRVLLKFKKEGI